MNNEQRRAEDEMQDRDVIACTSLSGVRDLLHRIGYEYKKPKLVPGNPDIDAQEIFVAQYDDFMLKKPADVEVLFIDAVHPEHNAMVAYG